MNYKKGGISPAVPSRKCGPCALIKEEAPGVTRPPGKTPEINPLRGQNSTAAQTRWADEVEAGASAASRRLSENRVTHLPFIHFFILFFFN